jgi:hypothetical protein
LCRPNLLKRQRRLAEWKRSEINIFSGFTRKAFFPYQWAADSLTLIVDESAFSEDIHWSKKYNFLCVFLNRGQCY